MCFVCLNQDHPETCGVIEKNCTEASVACITEQTFTSGSSTHFETDCATTCANNDHTKVVGPLAIRTVTACCHSDFCNSIPRATTEPPTPTRPPTTTVVLGQGTSLMCFVCLNQDHPETCGVIEKNCTEASVACMTEQTFTSGSSTHFETDCATACVNNDHTKVVGPLAIRTVTACCHSDFCNSIPRATTEPPTPTRPPTTSLLPTNTTATKANVSTALWQTSGNATTANVSTAPWPTSGNATTANVTAPWQTSGNATTEPGNATTEPGNATTELTTAAEPTSSASTSTLFASLICVVAFVVTVNFN